MRKARQVATLTSVKVVGVRGAVERLHCQGRDIVRLDAAQRAFASSARLVEATHWAHRLVHSPDTEPLAPR